MARITLTIEQFEVKNLDADGDHSYLRVQSPEHGLFEVFFRDKKEEKKIFLRSRLTLTGEWVNADGGNHLLNAHITHCELITEIPLESLSIKDRLLASGLIHEFRDIYRKDKRRAVEILKVLGVSEKYAEEILLRNSLILPLI